MFFYLSPPFPSAVHDPITRFVSRSQIPASSWRGLCCPKMCPGGVLREEGRPGGEQEEGGKEKEPLFAWLKGSTQPQLAGCLDYGPITLSSLNRWVRNSALGSQQLPGLYL